MQTDVTKVLTSSWFKSLRGSRKSGVIERVWSPVQTLISSRGAAIGLFVVLILLACAVAPGWIAPYDPNQPFFHDRLKPPLTGLGTSQFYLLGTDQLGRDILSRIIFSARTSVIIGLMAMGVSGGIGVSVGLLAGYWGGNLDNILMRVADIQLAFPYILLAIAIIGTMGSSVQNVVIVLGIANWVVYARIVRGETLAVREKAYVEAARCIGALNLRIILKYILPNVSASIIVTTTFGVGQAIISEAGLSFLGLGVPLAIPSWGGMLADGRSFVATHWWLALFPGLTIFIVVLAINVLGDNLRDVLDPYVTHNRPK